MLRIPRPGYLHRLYRNRRRVPSTTLREIEQALTCYELGRWQLVGPLLGGRSSYNFLLKTDRGEKVLKKYRWSLPAISREHAILRYLDDTDFPFPRVMLNRDGGTYTELNGERYAIYVFIRGFRYDDYYMPAPLSHRFIAQAGETLARFHRLMRGFSPEGGKIDGFRPNGERLWRDTGWHLDALEKYVGGIKRDPPSLLDSLVLHNLDKLRRDIAELGRWHDEIHPRWSKQVIHSDYVAKNIVFDSRGVAGVLDLSSAVLDLRILDIAGALQSFARRERYGLDASRARIFLDAYQAQIPVPDGEIALIPKLSRWRLLRTLVWRLQSDLPLSRKLGSFRNRWEQANWLERNEQRFLDALLGSSDHSCL